MKLMSTRRTWTQQKFLINKQCSFQFIYIELHESGQLKYYISEPDLSTLLPIEIFPIRVHSQIR